MVSRGQEGSAVVHVRAEQVKTYECTVLIYPPARWDVGGDVGDTGYIYRKKPRGQDYVDFAQSYIYLSVLYIRNQSPPFKPQDTCMRV